ncbi:hypothetical protein RHMOL_Rhmol08G0205000 [Rhododendron molle]|uniref:Uncharacterized protein n=1 Tax=Rhododendron molle TaxID=49168 RepID=A0ACC0MQP4_RHOML|nr:hypothetical protein RHMOL_Rhmol08G0205000 [Rhododendron molle]
MAELRIKDNNKPVEISHPIWTKPNQNKTTREDPLGQKPNQHPDRNRPWHPDITGQESEQNKNETQNQNPNLPKHSKQPP